MKAKQILALVLGFLFATTTFAGIEDWKGTYTVNASATESRTIIHTPTNVQFLFISAGKCIHLAKGSKMNGVEIKEDVNLCVSSSVETFTAEVQKLGSILNKSIIVGSTYPS